MAKFIPGLNAVAAPLAGASGVRMARFLVFDSIGALLWIGAYVSVGYIFSDQLEIAAAYALQFGSWLIYFIAGLLAGWIGWKFIQRRRALRKLAVERITAWELRERLRAGEDIVVIDLRSTLDRTESIPGASALHFRGVDRTPEGDPARSRHRRTLHLTQRSLERPCGAAFEGFRNQRVHPLAGGAEAWRRLNQADPVR